MSLLGIIFMAIGSFGIGGAVVLEIIYEESIYFILMKIFPWVFALGAIMLSLDTRKKGG